MTNATTDALPARRFPRDQAFVVQLGIGTDVTADRIIGRVEHIASGDTLHFDTAGELLAFFARTLSATSRDPR